MILSNASPQVWLAPAKINLFLHITGRRSDGYHLLQSIFQILDLADELTFAERDDKSILLESNLDGVSSEDNLVVRAVRKISKAAGIERGLSIQLNKIIPTGAGLGGGSSDAATTLVALNKTWKLGFSQIQLMEIGASLGADVPIFIKGENAWAEGIGEILKPVKLDPKWYLLLYPNIAISTVELFSHPQLQRNCSSVTFDDYKNGRCHNVCEPVVLQEYPEVARALEWLKEHNSEARMTGTGSTLFAPFDSKEEAERVASLSSTESKIYVCKSI